MVRKGNYKVEKLDRRNKWPGFKDRQKNTPMNISGRGNELRAVKFRL